MRVVVRSEHIAHSSCRVPERCMIAVAIKEAYPDTAYIRVKTNGITLTTRPENGPALTHKYMVPTKAAKAIIAFDNGEAVKPFTFTAQEVEVKPARNRTAPETKAKMRAATLRHIKLVAEGKKPKGPPSLNYRTRIAGV